MRYSTLKTAKKSGYVLVPLFFTLLHPFIHVVYLTCSSDVLAEIRQRILISVVQYDMKIEVFIKLESKMPRVVVFLVYLVLFLSFMSRLV